MSKIRYNGKFASLDLYQILLQNKINTVCRKIGFTDTGVSWVIFDAAKAYGNTMIGTFFVGSQGRDYGRFAPRTNEIWISTQAIRKDYPSLIGKFSDRTDFLADVLLDEITHFQTRATHGTPQYDNKLIENRTRYYEI